MENVTNFTMHKQKKHVFVRVLIMSFDIIIKSLYGNLAVNEKKILSAL